MKNIIGAILISVLSSVTTLVGYQYYINQQTSPVKDVVIKERMPAKQVRNPTNQRPYEIPSTTNTNTTNTNSGFTEAANIARPAVVHIQGGTGSRYEDMFGGGSSGSGVIVSLDGYIVTNNHVIDNATDIKVTLNDKRKFTAKVVGTDPSTDLAVIKIKNTELKDQELPVLEFENSEKVQVGEWVLAVGNPFNLTSTVTAGIVSAKGRNIDILEDNYSIESFIQTDAAVNPGNSGGALIDTEGKLVGINTAIITRSGRYEGYSFAIPSNLVRKVMKDLIEFGEVQRGFLGVTIEDISSEVAKKYDLGTLDGIYVKQVNEGSAAEEGGLEEGDVITHVNEVKVKTSPELQEQIALFRPGNKISIDFIRDGEPKTTELTLKNKANTTELGEKRKQKAFNSKDAVLSDMGIEARKLSENEIKQFKTQGVIITKIKKNSLIDETNMEKAFIITSINDKKIKDLDEFINTIYNAKGEIVLDGFYEEYPGEFSYVFDKE